MKISTTKTKSMTIGLCGKNMKRAKIVIDGTIIGQVMDFMYLGNVLFEFKTDMAAKIHRYNKISGTVKRHFGKNMLPSTKLRLYNITSKLSLKYGSEVWVLNKKECQQFETAKIKFLRSLLGLTRLDRKTNKTI
jgi:hypothetical protein